MPGALPRVGVVGLGLIGGSLLRALAAAGAAASGWDVDNAAGSAAAASGLRVASDLATLARESDVVFVAVPMPAVARCAVEVLRAAPGVVVSDVGSAKRLVVAGVLREAGPGESERFVGGHPLAGLERAGFEHSRADLFEGATWALCPGEASLASLVAVAGAVETAGARVVVVAPDEHDAAVARSSHLPHLLAALLAGDDGGCALAAALSGGALRDATRTADADAGLWLDILRANADAVAPAAQRTADQLAALARAIDGGEWGAVEALLRDGAEGRRRILGARWEPAVGWEAASTPVEGWRETLLALGSEGRAVRGLRVDGAVLRYEVAIA
jgi:prephenate dehydrogenase